MGPELVISYKWKHNPYINSLANGKLGLVHPYGRGVMGPEPRLPTARPPSFLELSFRDVAKDAKVKIPKKRRRSPFPSSE